MAIGNDLLEMIIRVCRMEAKYSPVHRVTVVRALRYKYTRTCIPKRLAGREKQETEGPHRLLNRNSSNKLEDERGKLSERPAENTSWELLRREGSGRAEEERHQP